MKNISSVGNRENKANVEDEINIKIINISKTINDIVKIKNIQNIEKTINDIEKIKNIQNITENEKNKNNNNNNIPTQQQQQQQADVQVNNLFEDHTIIK